jgi:hypothetical protein
MKTACRFAYVQARIQARLAGLPTEEEWQRLGPSRTLAGFLEEARGGVLRDWIRPFSGQSDHHDLEIGLRALYRDQVAEIARWVPAPWRDAVRWTRWLPLLPLFDHLARGKGMPAWVSRDHDLQPLLEADGGLSLARLPPESARMLAAGGSAGMVWLDGWHERWPPCKARFIANLEALETLLSAHQTAFHRSTPDGTWGLRRALRQRLRLLLHRYLLQPAAPFGFLALAVLEMERLRSELLTRALFAPQGGV